MLTCFSSAADYTLTKKIGGISVKTTVPEGRVVTLTFTKASTFTKWQVNSGTLAIDNPISRSITFSMPANDVEIEAIEEVQPTKQSLSVCVDGEIMETSEITIGQSITVTAVEGNGKTFSSWQITGLTGANVTANPLTFTMPNNAVEIIATFIVHTHSYSEATCTLPSTCSCGATEGNALGHSYTGTRTCNVNGSTDKVQCIRCSATENQDCTHTYTISKGTVTNGTITLSATTVKAGGSATATITPSSGYSISAITVNGTAVTVSNVAGMTHTISSITENKTVNATFVSNNVAPNKPTISVASKTSTTITFNLSGSDPDGDSLTYDVYVGGSKNGTTTSTTYTASGLTQAKQYAYYVIASDPSGATATSVSNSTYTKCSGATLSHNTSPCTGTCTACAATGYDWCDGYLCILCKGAGTIPVHDCNSYYFEAEYCPDCLEGGGWGCSLCGAFVWTGCACSDPYEIGNNSGSTCTQCYGSGTRYCSTHRSSTQHRSTTDTCDTCKGDKMCTHDVGSSHRYCTHYTNTSLTSHSYCGHDNTGEHAID